MICDNMDLATVASIMDVNSAWVPGDKDGSCSMAGGEVPWMLS